MKYALSISALLDELHKIYMRVAITVLHNRIDQYRKSHHNDSRPSRRGIKSSLLGCVSQINDEYQKKSKQNSDSTSTNVLDKIIESSPHHYSTYPPSKSRRIRRENVGELSRYFKSRSRSLDLHPDIKNKLQRSTWEHIHTAFRLASEGRLGQAKMHVNIASTACNELAHYMPKEDFQIYRLEIEEYIESHKSSHRVN